MVLTIAIPTYNRPDKVKNTVLRLLPQLTADVKIVILDNCSMVVIKDHLENTIGKEVSEKVEVVRNRVNIGADSNFQRCFELCTTPYLWMLGDDDKIEDNAVGLILGELEKYKHLDLIGINFNSNCNTFKRTAAVTISSTAELAEKLDHFGNWLFISTSVYKAEEYLKHIRYQAWGAYSMASQLVPPMVAISKNKTFILSEKYIVTNIEADEDDPGGKWSNYQLALSLPTLIEAPVGFKKDEFKKFGQKLETWLGLYPGDALYIILRSVNYNIDLIDDFHIYLYKQLFYRSFLFRSNKKFQAMQYYQCLFLLKNKKALKLLVKLVPKIKKKADEKGSFSLFKR
ncbi:MAG: hypothetical protein JWQ40_4054 [Segetibacter sp.]|nr:hypothetical protein [Segetibacter sp.]